MNLTAKYAGRVVEIRKNIKETNLNIGDRKTIEKILINRDFKKISFEIENDTTLYFIDYKDYNTPEKALKDYFKIVY
jgi:hypothetical protein